MTKRMLAAMLLVALGVGTLLLTGCSSGSPPTALPRTVTGTVMALSETAAPAGIANATVKLTQGTQSFQAVSGAGGAVSVPGVLAPGTYTLTVTLAGYQVAGTLPQINLPVGTTAWPLPGTIYLVKAPGSGGSPPVPGL